MELNNIVKIAIVPCNDITGLKRISATECKISADVPFIDFPEFKSPAQLFITDKDDDNNRTYTSKLSIMTCADWITHARRLAFLCETVSGIRYLVGNNERPYPVITQTQNHPSGSSDSQLTEVAVSWVSSKIPPIIR